MLSRIQNITEILRLQLKKKQANKQHLGGIKKSNSKNNCCI